MTLRPVVDYVVIYATSTEGLSIKVAQRLADKWMLEGPMMFTPYNHAGALTYHYHQVMIKREAVLGMP